MKAENALGNKLTPTLHVGYSNRRIGSLVVKAFRTQPGRFAASITASGIA